MLPLLLLVATHLLAQEPAAGLKPPLAGEAPPVPGQATGAPGAVPGGAPGMVPGAAPGMVPGGAPGMVPGGAPGTRLPEGAAPVDRKANPRQVIIRATTAGAKAVELTAEGGDSPLVVELNDAGTMPDMRAGDGEFAGQGLLPADEVKVTVKVDGTSLSAGTVSWEPAQELRVLEVTVADGAATARATVGSRNEKRPVAGETPPAPGEGQAPPAGARPPEDGGGRLLFPAAVLVGLVAAGALIGLLPRRAGGGGALPSGLVALPAGPILGPNTPTFQDGARVWGSPPEDRRRLLAALLDALAPGRDVVVAIPDGEPLPTPPPCGGVFRTSAPPKAVLAAAQSLARPGRPTVVLVVPPVGDRGEGWPDRAPGVEILVVASPPAEGMDVIVHQEGERLRVRSRQGEARIG